MERFAPEEEQKAVGKTAVVYREGKVEDDRDRVIHKVAFFDADLCVPPRPQTARLQKVQNALSGAAGRDSHFRLQDLYKESMGNDFGPTEVGEKRGIQIARPSQWPSQWDLRFAQMARAGVTFRSTQKPIFLPSGVSSPRTKSCSPSPSPTRSPSPRVSSPGATRRSTARQKAEEIVDRFWGSKARSSLRELKSRFFRTDNQWKSSQSIQSQRRHSNVQYPQQRGHPGVRNGRKRSTWTDAFVKPPPGTDAVSSASPSAGLGNQALGAPTWGPKKENGLSNCLAPSGAASATAGISKETEGEKETVQSAEAQLDEIIAAALKEKEKGNEKGMRSQRRQRRKARRRGERERLARSVSLQAELFPQGCLSDQIQLHSLPDVESSVFGRSYSELLALSNPEISEKFSPRAIATKIRKLQKETEILLHQAEIAAARNRETRSRNGASKRRMEQIVEVLRLLDSQTRMLAERTAAAAGRRDSGAVGGRRSPGKKGSPFSRTFRGSISGGSRRRSMAKGTSRFAEMLEKANIIEGRMGGMHAALLYFDALKQQTDAVKGITNRQVHPKEK
uniref:Uncharacterized protein n=1 Tax=Chromera velia CCMP2878 TaxID=1169474 RepID=A0A0G4HR55_9ALVE|eukprot:Cvel_8032.t1-p1 / transcript=Cvel_8032.t1 / gene=Cvel_8032 / organism=Chromera_velia_CCMP2878 / gene_product=hypothetical protein / transcript_product=hypothetical protein / location=Cvel_scaffold434:28353-30391(+) / protein_length=563 / sequence_SO=supercontig / SO=protein_coding / is_pseudo=false